MASEDLVVNRVHSSSTATPGRALNQVRTHQLVIDEPTHLGGPGEQITPAEAFLAGVSACGVLLVQGRARDLGVRLEEVEATIGLSRQVIPGELYAAILAAVVVTIAASTLLVRLGYSRPPVARTRI